MGKSNITDRQLGKLMRWLIGICAFAKFGQAVGRGKIFDDTNPSNPSELQSATIDFLRFPLAIAVTYIHMNPKTVGVLDADFSVLSWQGMYNIIAIAISYVLSQIAVPTFFIISGFLFFNNFKSLSWDGYKRKISSRIKSLLIPYILWNFVPWLLHLSLCLLSCCYVYHSFEAVQHFLSFDNFKIFINYTHWGESGVDWLGNNLGMTGPFNPQLWFLRELIVMCAISPLIYLIVKRLKLLSILLLILAYISKVWTLAPGFNIEACLYFTLGAYFALNGKNLVEFSTKYKNVLIPTSAILFVAAVIYNGPFTTVGDHLYPFFVITSTLLIFYVASLIVLKYKKIPCRMLINSCFFIYAFHAAPIPYISPISFCKRMLNSIIPGDTGLEAIIVYLSTPLAATLMCITVLLIGRKIIPNITKYFAGNR